MEMVKKKKKVFSVTLIILCVILALYTVILLVPLLWALYTSFIDYTMYDLGTAREDLKMMMNSDYLTLQNLITAFTKFKVDIGDGVHITEMFVYSVLYSGGCAIIATMVPCVVAYLVARYDYFLGKIVYGNEVCHHARYHRCNNRATARIQNGIYEHLRNMYALANIHLKFRERGNEILQSQILRIHHHFEVFASRSEVVHCIIDKRGVQCPQQRHNQNNRVQSKNYA